MMHKIYLIAILSLFISCSNDNINEPEYTPPSKAINPIPEDKSLNQELSILLSWVVDNQENKKTSYDLYFGTDTNLTLLKSDLDDNKYLIENLIIKTKYYWRIDSKDDMSITEGNIWSFSTGAAIANFDFVSVNAGEYTYGSSNSIKEINYDFEIMEFEVSNEEYVKFLNDAYKMGLVKVIDSQIYGYFNGDERWSAGEYLFYNMVPTSGGYNVRKVSWDGNKFNAPKEYEDHPVVLVTWFGANAFADFYDLRLPTEREWEKTARGNTGYIYPWGNDIDGNDANFWHSNDPWEKGTTPVGFYNGENGTKDRPSPYGAYDMVGNVWEWTSSYWNSTSKYRVIRGGAWNINGTNFDLKSFHRFNNIPDGSNHYIGFRCLRE